MPGAAEQVEAEEAFELPDRVALSIVDPAIFHPFALPVNRTAPGMGIQGVMAPKDR